MSVIQFRCAGCGRPLQCDEGAGEAFRCPSCGHLDTVPMPVVEPSAQVSRNDATGPAQAEKSASTQGVRPITASVRWTHRGIRLIRGSLWLLVAAFVLVLLIDLAAILLLSDGPVLGTPRRGLTGTGFIVWIGSTVLTVITLLVELAVILGKGFCTFLPTGHPSKGRAFGAVALAMLSLLWCLAAIVLWTSSPGAFYGPGLRDMGNPSPLGEILLIAATSAVGFASWFTFLSFLRSFLRALGKATLARRIGYLVVFGSLLGSLLLLFLAIAAGIEADGARVPPLLALALVGVMALIGVGAVVCFIWYLWLLGQASKSLQDVLRQHQNGAVS